MTYNIIASSSSGNCTIINGVIAIDLGIPFKSILPYIENLKLVLLTHSHSDHFNLSTIRKLAAERPTLRWAVPDYLNLRGIKNNVIDVFKHSKGMYYGKTFPYTIGRYNIPHNVPNCAWMIHYKDESMLYATDTCDLTHIEAPNFSLYMVEANYDEEEIKEKIQRKRNIGQYAYECEVIRNHLSLQKCNQWLKANAGINSEIVYMHKHKE